MSQASRSPGQRQPAGSRPNTGSKPSKDCERSLISFPLQFDPENRGRCAGCGEGLAYDQTPLLPVRMVLLLVLTLLIRLAFVSSAMGKGVRGSVVMTVTVSIWISNLSQTFHSALYLGAPTSFSPDRYHGGLLLGANSDPVSHSWLRSGLGLKIKPLDHSAVSFIRW